MAPNTEANLTAASGLRYLLTHRLDELDRLATKLEAQCLDSVSARGQLTARLHDAEVTWAQVTKNLHGFDRDDIERAFTMLAALRSHDAVLEERAGEQRARLDEVQAERDLLRTLHRGIEALLDDNAAGPRQGPPRLRNTSRQIFQIIEEERMRIARDMHDGPAQSMANLVLHAEILERLMARDPSRLHDELADFKLGVRRVLDETRRLIFDLRPMTLDDLGLVPTLRKFLPDYGEKNSINTHLQVTGEELRLPGALEATIFRIVQEALNNVRKHSRADNVNVSIIFAPGQVSAVVKDDGVGFDVTATEARLDANRNLGMISMRERAELERGQLQIRSQLNQGTEIRATFAV